MPNPIDPIQPVRNASKSPRQTSPAKWRTRAAWVQPALLALATAALVFRAWQGDRQGAVAWVTLLSALPGAALVGACLALWLGRGQTLLPGLLCAAFLAPAGWKIGAFPVAYPGAPHGHAALVRLPVDGPVIVAQGGRRAQRNHHAVLPNQRWAYDLVMPPVPVDGKANADHGCWGGEVLAPVGGVVVATVDAWPDPQPGLHSPKGAPPGGNQVVLRLSDGTHLFVAHLQRGSVAVREGDILRTGDKLGRCGNSGSSDAPHIHLHRQAEPPGSPYPELDTGLPLGFCGHDGPRFPEGWAAGLFVGPDPEPTPVYTHIDRDCR